ncbi:MAG: hypothetical protein C4323_13940 [Mastigocladus sp. ERB_26_2]
MPLLSDLLTKSSLILDNAESILGSGDRSVKLWDVRDGICLIILTGHTDWVRCVAFSPDFSRYVET